MSTSIVTTGQNRLVDRLPYGETPKTQAVESETLRNHLMLSHAADDDIVFGVGGYLMAATEDIENRANVALISQTRVQYVGEEVLGTLSGTTVAITVGPVASITTVKYLDTDGATQTMPATNYRWTHDGMYFKGNLPILADGPGTVWIEYVAGYGSTPAAVPSMWQNLIMHVAMRRYELRGDDPGRNPDGWERMLDRMILVAGGSRRGY